MNRNDLTKELLSLVDANPLTYVDILPIVERSTENLEFHEETRIRVTIADILRDLKEHGEIEYSNDSVFEITVSSFREFESSSALIKSSYKRQKEIENNMTKQPTYNFGDNFKGNVNTGTMTGNQEASFFEERPMPQPNKEPIAPQKNAIQRAWHWLMTNPMATTVIGGTMVAVIIYFLFKYFHMQ